MAEGASVLPDDVVCRYFFSSICREGNNCLFPHDITRRTPDSVCRYYLQGACAFGQNCRYDHVLVNSENVSKPHSLNHVPSTGLASCTSNRDSASNCPRGNTNNKTSHQLRLTSLSRGVPLNDCSKPSAFSPTSANWVNAPEFVPKHSRLYADAVKANIVINDQPEIPASEELCPYLIEGVCPFGEFCLYVHGNICELCHKACLHPHNEEQRKIHLELCEKEFEKNMEFSFAMQRSMEKACGICMDVVLEKEPMSERRFGILEKCNHVFCLSCIRQWRRSRQIESNQQIENTLDPVATRGCPECRIASDFIIPSAYFIDTEEEKDKLITDYKKALNKKPCKYFKQGQGTCPFGGACFYLHAKPDGTIVNLPLPKRRRRQNQDGELNYVDPVSLWHFFEHRDIPSYLTRLSYSSSDSDDEISDLSENSSA